MSEFPSTARRWVLVTTVAGAVSATLGIVVLVGWYTHTVILIQLLPAFVPMQYNTALGFLLCGSGLVALVHGRTRLAMALGSVAGTVGILTLIEYVFGVQLGIDQLFLEHYITVQTSHPGRMAPNTALCFSLTAAALIAAARWKQPGQRFRIAGVLGVVVLSLSIIAFFGYVTGARTAYGWGQMTRMAVHTSAGFVALALGILTLAFREGVVWAATSNAFISDKPLHERRKIVAASIGIMALFSMAVGLTVIRELYSTGLDVQRERLMELVRSRTRMIEAVARFEEQYSRDVPGGARAATLSQVVETHERSPGFGQTGEFTLARREGDEIIFIVRPPHAGPDFVARVAVASARAEPMERALDGESGTLIGIDYRAERVVAAYAPVTPLDLGIVAKMDLSEVRAPFVRSAFLTLAIALMIIAIGAGATMLSIGPLARRVETQAMDLHLANVELTREVSERRQAEEALATSAETLRVTLDAISDGSWEWNIVTGDVAFSDKWLNSLGFKREEVTPDVSFWKSLIHPDDMSATMEALAAHLEGRTESYSCENRLRKKSGEYRWNVDRGRVVERDPDGKPLRMVGADTDVTELETARTKLREMNVALERRVAERTGELEAANKELEAFSYSVSHDLKAPLRAIDGYSAKIEEELGERLNPEGRRLLDVVRQRAQHMGRLIDDLLAFSRLGRAELRITDVDMGKLAQTTFAELAAAHAGREIEFAIGDLPTVRADLDLMGQAWANLLDNAIKFTGQREVARIEVGYREEADRHVFFVRDNGAGFDMEYVDKLFGVFQRLHYRDEFPGTGVGLANVRRIVERHGGGVWAEGEVDHGATIFFRLPRTERTT